MVGAQKLFRVLMALWGPFWAGIKVEDGRATEGIEKRSRTEITEKSGESQSCWDSVSRGVRSY